ncbi:HpaII family restriction endonuclease [Flavobacterium sp. RHBU_3]|uniref:HpaII family restriction endonuclease n=1 Tax=Flavobacterium sp. RHBU_3 TaxID=3391184 RepID=UPI0039849B74
MLKGNKGEWSELYVFAKLLAEGKLYQSDIELKRDDNFYEITKAYREDAISVLEYQRDEQIVIFRKEENSSELLRVLPKEYFTNSAIIILDGIIKGTGKSFEIPQASEFISLNGINKLTALTTSKSDIKLRIYDHRLARETDLGFSIKSLLGQDSTLLNTGPGNNFIYNIIGSKIADIDEFNIRTYKPAGKISKLTARLSEILTDGASISFKEIQSKQLWLNLKMIDGDLPQILAFALTYRWIYRQNSLKEICSILEEKDPMNFYNGINTTQMLYEYKLKKFLAECAMGMTSETPWEGIYDATGGVIIVKEDGDIVCFHVYDFNLFRDYLLNNTIFEQPSTGEDGNNPGHERAIGKKYYYGWLYREGDDLQYKINLQIRFK